MVGEGSGENRYFSSLPQDQRLLDAEMFDCN